MASRTSIRLCLACALLGLTCSAGCEFSSNITLRNQTPSHMTPYPVTTEPPPPHREADPANNVGPGHTTAIDPHGFNPVYYVSGITDPTHANGIYIGLDLDDDPYMIQYKVFHYKVPPGQAGKDPAVQPILLKQGVTEVEDVDQLIRVIGLIPHEHDWTVLIVPH